MLRLALRRRAELQAPPSLDWLTAGERSRQAGFTGLQRRASFVAGRWLLRDLLAAVHGGRPADHAADIDALGATRLERGHANLSHSGEWLLAAWADAPIGVDVEVLRERGDLLGIAERVAPAAECEQLACLSGAARLEAFYRLWTLREAWLKRRGRGLDLRQMQALHLQADEHGDLASVVLPRGQLMLAIDVENLAGATLPETLNDEPLHWERWRAGPAS